MVGLILERDHCAIAHNSICCTVSVFFSCPLLFSVAKAPMSITFIQNFRALPNKTNPMKRTLLAFALAAGLTSFAGSTKASPTIYEDFYGYPSGSVNGKNGGSGFSAPWSGNNFSVTQTTFQNSSLPITFNSGVSSPNSGSKIYRNFSKPSTAQGTTYYFTESFRSLAPAGTTASVNNVTGYANSIFTSFFGDSTSGLVQANGGLSYDIFIDRNGLLQLSMRMGNVNGSATVQAYTNIPANPSVNWYQGTITIAGEIIFGTGSSDTTMNLWLNPSLADGLPAGTPTLSATNGSWVDPGVNNSVGIVYYGDSTSMAVTHLVLSTNYADLNLVPEPSTYALLVLGALALVVAYRRKAA